MRALRLLLILVLLLAPGVAAARIELPSIKNALIELALSQISSPGSFEVTAGGIEDAEIGGEDVTSLLDVQVSDGEGVWLTLERANFSWAPDRLLAGELAITRLELIGLTVLRRPAESAEAPELKPGEPSGRGLFDWPRSPIDLSVEGVRLERVRIAEGVLAAPISFDAEARAYDKGDLQELSLKLARTDAVKGEIALAMRRDFAANRLRLDLTASEAAGGLVAAEAGLPADAPARLNLAADGPPEDWRLAFEAAVERVFAAEGGAALSYAGPLSVDTEFFVTAGPALGPEARAILGERAHLTARLVEGPDGVITVERGELVAPALTLGASGALATAGGDSDLAVRLEALAPLAALVEGLDFERFGFDGRVHGPSGGLVAEGKLSLDGLATGPADAGRLALDGAVAQSADGFGFRLEGTGEGVRLDRLAPEVTGTARLAVAGRLAGEVLTLESARLDSPRLAAEASGHYDIASRQGKVAARLSAPDLATVATAYGVTAGGAASVGAEAVLSGEDIDATVEAALTGFSAPAVAGDSLRIGGRIGRQAGRLSFDLDGAGQGLRLDRVPAELTGELSLAAKGTYSGNLLRLDQLRLAAPLLTAGVHGEVAPGAGTMALDYTVSTADLAPVAAAYGAELAGALSAQGKAEGPLAAPLLAGRLTLGQARVAGRGYGDATLAHEVTLGAAPEGHLSLTAMPEGLGTAMAETRFRYADAVLALRDLSANALGAAVSGAVQVDLDGRLTEGALQISARDLGPLGRFAGVDLSGSAEGRLRLSASGGRQDAAGSLTLREVASGGAGLAAAEIDLKAADVTGAPRLDARLSARGLASGAVALDDLEATASGPLRALALAATAGGRLGQKPLALSLVGTADAAGDGVALKLDRAEVSAGEDGLRLGQPLALRIGGGSVVAEGIDLVLPAEGRLSGAAALRPGGFTGDLTLVQLPLALVGRWTAAPVTGGLLDARAAFDTRAGRARAAVTAAARDLSLDRTQTVEGLGIDLAADWDGARLAAQGTVTGEFGKPLEARIDLPLRPGPDGIPQIPARGEIGGAVTWAGRIGDLWALVPLPGHILDGDAEIDLRLAGRVDAPRLEGRAALADGTYQNLDSGTILTGLTLDTDLAPDGAIAFRLGGADGGKGQVAASGRLRLDPAPELELAAEIAHATLVRRDDLTARLSGTAEVKGPVAAPAVTARLTIDKAELRLVNAMPPDVVELEGIRTKGAPEPDGNGRAGSAVALDIEVEAPRDIFVRGRGLESEWGMQLAVGGTAAAPVVTGSIEKVRGRLELLGRPFELTRGRVAFDGGRAIDPLLDVALEREANGIRGGIVIDGRASAPALRLVSTPALPEDEVLPRLLFGRSRQSLSGPEAVQLATGVATLMSGSSGPLDILRAGTGLDVLRVEGETVEESTVTVGRNVGEGVFVGARQGLGEQGTAVTVEVEVFDGVTVDTELRDDGGSSLGFTLRKDF